MKTKAMIILVVAMLFVITTTAMASEASELIGTITCHVERIQSYPGLINDALCNGNSEQYRTRMSELATWIMGANNAMNDARLPNTLNLWAVYGAIAANPNCGVHDAALSRADWSREELDRIGYRFGLFESGMLKGTQCSMAYVPAQVPEEEVEVNPCQEYIDQGLQDVFFDPETGECTWPT